MPSPALRFGPFTLLPGEHRLLRAGADVSLCPRAFAMLCLLAQRPGQLVSKDDLLDTVWHGLVVEEANLHVQVSLVRKVIGADAVVTVPGFGYRFALPIKDEEEGEKAGDAEGQGGLAAKAFEADKPLRRLSVIVLPFVESGAPPEQEYFADAITDEVTTQISKIRGSYVIASPTALAHKREQFDVATLARELGVRYVLQGRVDRSEASVEANVRLSDAATGAVVWSDVIEVPKVGVGHIRHELVARLAAALGLELIAAEAGRTRVENADHPEAIALVMQATALGSWSLLRERCEMVIGLCNQALQLQPDYAPALALRARFLAHKVANWPGPDAEALIAQADRDIARALAQDSLDARCYAILARVRQLQFRLEAAVAAMDQALLLNPNDTYALSQHSWFLILGGESERAPEPLHRALTLSPRDPGRWGWLFALGFAHLLSGEYEQAVLWCEKSSALSPLWQTSLFHAAALAHLGREGEASAALARAFELKPAESSLKHSRTSNNETYLAQTRQHFSMGLHKAGDKGALDRYEAWAAFQRRGGKP